MPVCSNYVSIIYKGLQALHCTDINKSPGPDQHNVDPNVAVFGQNAEQQCVTMSLYALIYYDMKGISCPDDLIQVMNNVECWKSIVF